MYSWYNHSFAWSPWGFGFGLIGLLVALVFVIVLISLKGYALWHAARRSERWWFIAILVLNTIGILELAYLLFVVGKWHKFADNGTSKGAQGGDAPKA